jgi:hypothetical protein
MRFAVMGIRSFDEQLKGLATAFGVDSFLVLQHD